MRKVVFLICFVFVAMLLIPANTLAVTLVDNFNSYATGPVNTAAKPPWTEGWNIGGAASTIAGSGGNNYLVSAVTVNVAQTGAVWRGVTAIPNADTATTLFLRFRAETSTANSSFGLTDMAPPTGYLTGGFGDYANQMRVSVQTGVLGFDVRNGTGFNATRYAINVGQWYNVWAVVNNSTDKYDVYMTTGLDDAITGTILYQQTVQGFRKTSTNPLGTFLAMTQGGTVNNGLPLDLDDIYLTPGSHLEMIPEPATMILLGLGGLVLRRRK
jgi:hypothetical protein